MLLNKKAILFTQGSYGIDVIKHLFKFGYIPKDIVIISDNDKDSNLPLISFLKYFNIYYFISQSRIDIFNFLKNYHFDFIISIANRIILTNDIISSANIIAINLHPGILPFYKGSYSTPWSIINNEKYVGYSYHIIDEGIDTGEILYVKKFALTTNDNAFNLNFKIMYDAISKLSYILENHSTMKRQFNSNEIGIYYKNEFPCNGVIQNEWDSKKVERFFRASFFPPFVGAKIVFNNDVLELKNYEDYLNISKK